MYYHRFRITGISVPYQRLDFGVGRLKDVQDLLYLLYLILVSCNSPIICLCGPLHIVRARVRWPVYLCGHLARVGARPGCDGT